MQYNAMHKQLTTTPTITPAPAYIRFQWIQAKPYVSEPYASAD